MSGPVATLRSRASHVVRRLIAYEHRLGERVLPFVTERQEHSAPAPGQPELPRAPGEHEDGRLASLAPHLELAPAHAEPEPRAERLERSEEHTSELQSPCNLVCRLLLEKKKNK